MSFRITIIEPGRPSSDHDVVDGLDVGGPAPAVQVATEGVVAVRFREDALGLVVGSIDGNAEVVVNGSPQTSPARLKVGDTVQLGTGVSIVVSQGAVAVDPAAALRGRSAERRCTKGHPVGADHAFCETCGARAEDQAIVATSGPTIDRRLLVGVAIGVALLVLVGLAFVIIPSRSRPDAVVGGTTTTQGVAVVDFLEVCHQDLRALVQQLAEDPTSYTYVASRYGMKDRRTQFVVQQSAKVKASAVNDGIDEASYNLDRDIYAFCKANPALSTPPN